MGFVLLNFLEVQHDTPLTLQDQRYIKVFFYVLSMLTMGVCASI